MLRQKLIYFLVICGSFISANQLLAQAGCISDIPTLWLKADKGATPIAGGTLTAWANQANTITMTVNNAPTLVPNSTNFNPSVQFNGTTNYLQGSGNIVNAEAFAVFGSNGPQGTVIGYTTPTPDGASVYFFQDRETDFFSGAPSPGGSYDYAVTAALPQHINLTQTSLSDDVIRINGVNQGGSYDWAPSHTKTPMIGRRYSSPGVFDSYLNGTISEILIFGNTLTNTKRELVESYLGIKYGITLAHNYYSPTQVNLFTSNGGAFTDFDGNIFGIGRSDCQELHQRQAKSVNPNGLLTIGLTTIAATNNANVNNLTNETYLLIGDNNVAAGTAPIPNAMANACKPPIGITGLFNRAWKVQETGNVGTTLLRVATANLTGLSSSQAVYLVVADDNALTTNVKYILMTTNGSNKEVSYDFNGTKYFSFAGGLGGETVCTGYHYVRWATQGWTAGSLTKTVALNNGLTMTTTLTDPQSVLRSGYPKLYQGLPSAYISTNSASKSITWTSQFNQIIASCNFSVYDIDNVGTLSEYMDVKGYKGATLVNPTLSRAAISSVNINGTVSTGQINNIEPYAPYAKTDVSFSEPIDKVIITYKNNKNTLYPRGALMLLSDFAIFCPAPVATVDKISLSKGAPTGNIYQGDTITYTFQYNNADCAAKTVNFTDVLPTGFTWSPNSLITPLNGTVNNYGGTNTISITNMSVPTGISTFTVSAYAGAAVGTHNNQAAFVVNGTTYQSDDPNQVGANNATPITIIAAPTTAPLTMTKAVSAASVFNNGVLTFTYTFNNTGGTAIVTEFTDEIQPDTVRYKAGSLTFGAGMTGTANAYASVSSLYINNLSIPIGTSTLTVQVEMNGCEAGNYQNVAMVIPTAASGFRETELSSNAVSWAVIKPAAFQYAYNCKGSTVQGNFIANGVTGQNGFIQLAINVLNVGATYFTVTGAGFTGSLAATLDVNTTAILIPITYDGSGSDGSRGLTITSAHGIGSCTVSLNIAAACKAAGGRIGQ
ncbi:MAG: hypothetical protein RIS64_1017 [Bacteroidota bacterium]|jgi:uncharacterized repeat protein (TIGR01451 family)